MLNAFRAFSLGVEPDASNQNQEVNVLLELIQREGQAIGQLGRDVLTVIAETATNSVRCLRAFEPGCFRGELLLFIARESRLSPVALVNSWTPYIDGNIHVHHIQARHTGLMRPDALEQVGRVLTARLADVQ